MSDGTVDPVLCLASASPRRQSLLRQIGVPFVVDVADLDESQQRDEAPDAYVERLARAKALAVWERRAGDLPVLGADTTVVVDGAILGKPSDQQEAVTMLARLSARQHVVLTSIALMSSAGLRQRTSLSKVSFRATTAAERQAYWRSGEPVGKAGGYAVQGFGAVFIESLQGSYSGVMGLPLHETAELLRVADIPYWQPHVATRGLE
ncbi:MAG TPA: nucleoside triphosphate pyrophosphatase [Steroidobacteraceae bacterium]|nr:nucleoside triphosphate pyrophosphatase [Steroidobacteraceae bacterium]HRX89655.1 nucleoside triphosphate pyrophosphatase [Steroidobacteraceae bacterium]